MEGYESIPVGVEKTLSILSRRGIKGKMLRLYLELKQIICTLHKSKKDDVILVWGHQESLIINMISKFYGGGERLILMNFLTPKTTNKIIMYITKKALCNKKNTIVVNSLESIAQYKATYNLKEGEYARFAYLPDVYDDADLAINPQSRHIEERYFFTGGMAFRDWKLVCEVARKCPNERFVCCALKEDFECQVQNVPQNVCVYFDIPSDKYYNLMANSYCVLLPLRENMVAGLINILKAIKMGIICYVTRTEATKKYYSKENQQYTIEQQANVEQWIEKIKKVSAMSWVDYCNIVFQMQDYIEQNYSPKQALIKLQKIILEK